VSSVCVGRSRMPEGVSKGVCNANGGGVWGRQVGADLSYILTAQEAAIPIKAYRWGHGFRMMHGVSSPTPRCTPDAYDLIEALGRGLLRM
jgi:hypothetical protein